MTTRILAEIEELKNQNAELKAMMIQLIRSVSVPMEVCQPKSPGEIALAMARAGDVEASKVYLKSLSKRRAA